MAIPDLSTATSFADLADLMQAATTVVAGVAQWGPHRVVLGRGAEPLASDLACGPFISVLTEAMAPFDDPPDVGDVYVTARVAGQTAPMAYGAALQKSTLFLFGRADHGGLRKVEGLVAYPTAFPPTPPAPPSPAAAAAPQVSNPPASSSSPAEPEPAEGVASEQAAKRARVDAGGDGAVAAAAGASLTPIQQLGPALTDASPTEQFKHDWGKVKVNANFFEAARFVEPKDMAALAARVIDTEKLTDLCFESCRDHPAELGRELAVVRTLRSGIRLAMSYKQPQLTALYIHGMVGTTSQGQRPEDREAAQKSVSTLLKTAKNKSGFDEFAGWNRDGSVTPRAIYPRTPQRQGGYGNQHRGSGHYGPQAQNGGGRGGPRQLNSGRGGGQGFTGRAPVCRRCSNAGLDADHGFRTCPQTKCNRCHQLGHIGTACPNP